MRHSLVLVLIFVCLLEVVFNQIGQCQKVASTTNNRIEAVSAPYRIEWDGNVGYFSQIAVGETQSIRTPLLFLHNDPGPAGFSKNLAWFIARGENSFSILWCYLDDSGQEFSCWLYRYPQNQLFPIRFTGEYRFTPPAEPTSGKEIDFAALPPPPQYVGPSFTFKDWTSGSNSMSSLKLTHAGGAESSREKVPESRTLSHLRVHPLHHVQVGAGNGWRSSGWTELHALAIDDSDSPFYLILYSNSTTGYAIDLKTARTYSAEFGERVQFGKSAILDPKEIPNQFPPTIQVKKRGRFEFAIASKAIFANPYKEGQVSFIMQSPEGKTTLVPGFWDGGTTWKLRFAPGKLGTWSFQSLSKTEDMNGVNGTFECVKEDEEGKGFIGVQPSYQSPRHFAYSNGEPFLPVPILGSVGESLFASGSPPSKKDVDSDFDRFQLQVDSLASAGFNRLIGGFLIQDIKASRFPFADSKLDALQLSYFQRLDKRVAYYSKGIVPDLGLGIADDFLFERFGSENLFRFWGYVLSRYAAYDVVWNLYERDGRLISTQTRKNLTDLAELTRLYDPYHHIRTAITPGAAVASSVADESSTLGVIPNYGRWQDCITLRGGDLNAIPAFQKENKPLIILDAESGKRIPKDTARKRMWESRFQGAYWVGDLQAFEPGATNDPVWKMSVNAGAFFKTTKFSRLAPSQELLGGDGENPSDRKRRQKATELLQKANPTKELNPNPDSLRYVLSSPAREYAVYFEKGGTILLDLLEATGRISASWHNPRTGETTIETTVFGGSFIPFATPDANDWILHLSRR